MTIRMKIMKAAVETVSHIFEVADSSKLPANYEARMLVCETVLLSQRAIDKLNKRKGN